MAKQWIAPARRGGLTRWRSRLLTAVIFLSVNQPAGAQIRYVFQMSPTQRDFVAVLNTVPAKEQPSAAALCDADPGGHLSNCNAISEDPQGRGLGDALIQLAPKFRALPKTGACARLFSKALIFSNWPSTGPALRAVKWPDDGDIASAYPARALKDRLSGGVVVSCHVGKDGRISDCRVLYEAPIGAGFGEASIALAKKYSFDMSAVNLGEQSVELLMPMNFIPTDGFLLNCGRW